MSPPISYEEDEELSDEQIQQLLEEAKGRLTASAEHDRRISARAQSSGHLIPRLQTITPHAPYIHEKDGIAIADPKLLISAEQRKLAESLPTIEPASSSKKMNDQLTAGPAWFDMPKTVVTDQLKRDLQLLEMRSVLDPHRHYKKDSRKGKVPTFSQVGTVIEGPTEWYSGRINKKDRAKNFVEEAMTTERDNGRFKRKYAEIQDKKTSGKKAHYKKLMAKRKKS